MITLDRVRSRPSGPAHPLWRGTGRLPRAAWAAVRDAQPAGEVRMRSEQDLRISQVLASA